MSDEVEPKRTLAYLTREELEPFRGDLRELEKDIQSFFRVYYISGVIAVVAWLASSQSKPIAELAIGNGGYNIYALLGLALLNMVSTTFLIYKSISIHEIAQFTVLLSKEPSVFDYWENWRRSAHYSATKPVRFLYTPFLILVPFGLSAIILVVTGYMLFADPVEFVERAHKLQPPAVKSVKSDASNPDAAKGSGEAGEISPELHEYAERVLPVFKRARIIFVVIVFSHLGPLALAFTNTYSTGRKWNRIRQKRHWDRLLAKIEYEENRRDKRLHRSKKRAEGDTKTDREKERTGGEKED